MPTGFDIPYTPYHEGTEIRKLCIFIGVEITIALIALTYKFVIVNRCVLGPTDAQLREKDQQCHPEIWAEHERQSRGRRSSGRPYASFSLARRSSSNLATSNGRNTMALVRTDTADSHAGKAPTVEGLETVDEATEEASPQSRQASRRGMDGLLARDDDEDDKRDQSPTPNKTRPKLGLRTSSLSYAEGTNEARAPSRGPSIPERSSSRLATASRPEMSELLSPGKLRAKRSSSLFDSPRGRSPASIVRMYGGDANDDPDGDKLTLASSEAEPKEESSSSQMGQRDVSLNTELEEGEYEPIKPASSNPSRSAYKQSGSPIDKYGRRGRESVSPKELKRNGVLDSVRYNIRRSLVDDEDD